MAGAVLRWASQDGISHHNGQEGVKGAITAPDSPQVQGHKELQVGLCSRVAARG